MSIRRSITDRGHSIRRRGGSGCSRAGATCPTRAPCPLTGILLLPLLLDDDSFLFLFFTTGIYFLLASCMSLSFSIVKFPFDYYFPPSISLVSLKGDIGYLVLYGGYSEYISPGNISLSRHIQVYIKGLLVQKLQRKFLVQ